MKWAFDLLQLPQDADATSIKRAYAQLLRSTRPDEDPEGFQRLHAAYKTALAQAGKLAPAPMPAKVIRPSEEPITSAPPVDAAAAVVTHAPQVVTPATPAPVINIGMLTNEVIRVATSAADSGELSTWLQSRQGFWSIQVKQQTGHAVMQRLFQQPRAMSADCLNALLRFFDLDHVLSGLNPYALQQLRRRQSLQWELMPEHRYELMQRLRLHGGGHTDREELQQFLTLLQQPLTWFAVVKTVLRGGMLDRLGHFLQALCHGHLDDLPATIDRRNAQFWYKANHAGSMSAPRFAVNTLRVTAIGFICALLASGVLATSFSAGSLSAGSALRMAGTYSFAILGGVIGAWLLIAGWIYLDDWQGLPESSASRWPWLRRLLIPALCAIGLALHGLGVPDYVTGPLVFIGLISSIRRYRRRVTPQAQRQGLRIRTMLRWLYLCAIGGTGLIRLLSEADFPIIPAGVVITIGIWCADMWRHRAYLHPKFARN